MKRHPAPVPFSHDHHHALVHARRLRAAAEGAAPRAAAETFLRFFAQETVAHFREEEEQLFPLVADAEEAREPILRALLEHQRIHALVARLGALDAEAPTPELMVELGATLEVHVRFEERELFPLIERVVPELALLGAPAPPTGGGPVWGIESEDLNATILEWPPGHRAPRHVNNERDVLVVVLAGSAEVAYADRVEMLRSGEALIIPKRERRQITAGHHGVRYLSAHRRRPPLQVSRSHTHPTG